MGRLSRIGLKTLGDVPFLGGLSRVSLKALGDISKRNGLKGLNQKGWLLRIRDLSTDYGLGSLLRHLKIQTSKIFCRPMKLFSLSQLIRNKNELSSLSLLWSAYSLGASGGVLMDGWRIVHLVRLP